jgi:hypothetical protein
VIAAAKLAGRVEGSVTVFGYELVVSWPGDEVLKAIPHPDEYPRAPVCRWGEQGAPPDVDLVSFGKLKEMFMRELPEYRKHPLLVLPEGSFARLSKHHFPPNYLERFERDPTQLDGRTKVAHHLREAEETLFKAQGGAQFTLAWWQIWAELKSGAIQTST